MDDLAPADFYTGIVVDVYGPLRSAVPDPEVYASFLRTWGTPALELGCGDGDPLLALRSEGFEVEGLDSSADMLAKLTRTAATRGIEVTVHHTAIEDMELDRTYRSIFLAGPTFNLITDDGTAQRALGRIRRHLDPAGAALVPLFVPAPVAERHLGRPREHVDERGRTLRVTTVASDRDDRARRQTSVLRYEIVDGERTQTVERPWTVHWYDTAGFGALAESAGLRIEATLGADGTNTPPDPAYALFVLRRADATSTTTTTTTTG